MRCLSQTKRAMRTAVWPRLARRLGMMSSVSSWGVRISVSPSSAMSVLRSAMTSPPRIGLDEGERARGGGDGDGDLGAARQRGAAAAAAPSRPAPAWRRRSSASPRRSRGASAARPRPGRRPPARPDGEARVVDQARPGGVAAVGDDQVRDAERHAELRPRSPGPQSRSGSDWATAWNAGRAAGRRGRSTGGARGRGRVRGCCGGRPARPDPRPGSGPRRGSARRWVAPDRTVRRRR